MQLAEELVKTINETYSGSPWYGPSIKEKLTSISHLQAIVRFAPGKKNIAEYVEHMLAWRMFVIERLQGNFDYKIDIDSEVDWPRVDELDEAGWKNLLDRLDESQWQLTQLISVFPDENLDTKIPFTGENNYTYNKMLHGLYQHDVYHLGQISLVLSLIIDNL